MQTARALTQQGLSTEPAHPMQALGRLAQTLAGAYMQHQATTGLSNAYASTAEGLASTLEKTAPGHPLVAALRSSNPTIRMMAVKQGVDALSKLPEAQEKIRQFNLEQRVREGELGLRRQKLEQPEFGTVAQDEFQRPTYGWKYPTTQKVVPYALPSGGAGANTGGSLPRPTTKAERDALASGAQYLDPTGQVRVRE